MWMAERLQQNGVVLADEVGTGKTRIACAVVHRRCRSGRTRGRRRAARPDAPVDSGGAQAASDGPCPRELTTFTEFLREGAESRGVEGHQPATRITRVVALISHGFRAPLVRSNSDDWRVALPSLSSCSSPAGQARGRRTLSWEAARGIIDTHESVWWDWNGMVRICQRRRSSGCGRTRLCASASTVAAVNDGNGEQRRSCNRAFEATMRPSARPRNYWVSGSASSISSSSTRPTRAAVEVDIEDTALGAVVGQGAHATGRQAPEAAGERPPAVPHRDADGAGPLAVARPPRARPAASTRSAGTGREAAARRGGAPPIAPDEGAGSTSCARPLGNFTGRSLRT